MANSSKSMQFLMESRIEDAAHRWAPDARHQSAEACFDLGVAYSCGHGEHPIDLIEAHKWFNLAALKGSEEGQSMRAEIAEEMSAAEIAQAQRQARAWIAGMQAGTA